MPNWIKDRSEDYGYPENELYKTTSHTAAGSATIGYVNLITPNVTPYSIAIPSAATSGAGSWVIFKNITNHVYAVTLDPASTETIDGASTYVMDHGYECVYLVSDGTNWVVI